MENLQLKTTTPQHLIKTWICDVLFACIAGMIVGTAYYFFQNSHEFAPGGVGGLATSTHHLLSFSKVNEVFGNFKRKVSK